MMNFLDKKKIVIIVTRNKEQNKEDEIENRKFSCLFIV